MIHLKVSLVLGGDPYDQARVDNIETLVRDRLADMLESDRGFVDVARLPCGIGMGPENYFALCQRPSGHGGSHSRIHDNDDWRLHSMETVIGQDQP